jgi:hypothetical protein
MKLVSLIFTLSLLSPIAAHAQEANVKKVLNMYDAGSELSKRKDTPPLYCVPDGFGLTGEQILEMLRKEVKENPSSAEDSYGLVMLLTLKKAFPCNK